MKSKMRYFMAAMLACLALAAAAQEADEGNAPVEWFLDLVVGEAFVHDNSFEYYYTPTASDMRNQIAQGEVTYFLNTPPGLNRKRACELIDGIMASYDDIMAMNDWQATGTTHWKEFRCERNKFHFSIKDKALDDGTYYVSVTESANHFKSLARASQETKQEIEKPTAKRTSRGDRKPVVVPDELQADDDQSITVDVEEIDEESQEMTEREQQEAIKREQQEAKRLEKEKQREQARAEREAEKLRKAEEKKAKQEQLALKKEQEKLRKEQEKQLKEEERQQRAAERQQQALAREEQKKEQARLAAYNASKYHYSDVALWLSDKYDFTQTQAGENTITMYSIAIKDIDMAKLAIKNALKGSNARMAMPWRTGTHAATIETGYRVDSHVLVFAIGSNDAGNITLTITEMDNEDFESFKQGIDL